MYAEPRQRKDCTHLIPGRVAFLHWMQASIVDLHSHVMKYRTLKVTQEEKKKMLSSSTGFKTIYVLDNYPACF